MPRIEDRLKELGVRLPDPPGVAAAYVPAVRSGNLVFVSGHGPMKDGALTYLGKVGRDLDVETAYQAARLVAVNALASLKQEIGDLDRVSRIVKLLGIVNSAPGFTEQPSVINGASELLIDIFQERGNHARSAVGVAELPFGISVEIEMIVEIDS